MKIFCYIAILSNLLLLGGHPMMVEEDGAYSRYALTDSTSMEVYRGTDSIFVVMTSCAPQCSSCARIYNKEWQYIRTITPPFSSIFPLATIDKKNGHITWSDNDTWEY
ncbi:MAG: hypothetical protein ACI4AI_06760 [Paludibacteraceae bacterium]